MTASRPARADAGWLAVAVLAGSQFLAVMSTTVVSVALPVAGRVLQGLGPVLLEQAAVTTVRSAP
jgi:hypothetical protein